MGLAWHLLRRRIGPFGGRRIAMSLLRYAAAAVPTGIAGWLLLLALGGATPGGFGVSGKAAAVVTMAVVGALMLLVYFGMLVVLRVPELRGALAPLRDRFVRR